MISPCIGICSIRGGVCRGCGRAPEQIQGWAEMTDEERSEVMSDRKPGWYWVRLDEASPDVLRDWEPCLWVDGEWDDEDGYDWDEYGEVGPRIPTPDEDET